MSQQWPIGSACADFPLGAADASVIAVAERLGATCG
jgi:hypothetical protein